MDLYLSITSWPVALLPVFLSDAAPRVNSIRALYMHPSDARTTTQDA